MDRILALPCIMHAHQHQKHAMLCCMHRSGHASYCLYIVLSWAVMDATAAKAWYHTMCDGQREGGSSARCRMLMKPGAEGGSGGVNPGMLPGCLSWQAAMQVWPQAS